jgi:TDG/mug DNA glycosylase family protein
MRTLPDYLAPGLRLLSIGLNPSVPSIAAGYYFANPRNRFWQALNGSRLLDAPLQPGTDAMQCLFNDYGFGFTDLVKRPSRGSAELRAADYKAGAQRLQSVLENCQPAIAWFHGKVAYKQFLRRTGRPDRADSWGLQSQPIGTTQCFVTPNPSPANAAFSLRELIAWYDLLASRVRASS